jgi:hypothetical protein
VRWNRLWITSSLAQNAARAPKRIKGLPSTRLRRRSSSPPLREQAANARGRKGEQTFWAMVPDTRNAGINKFSWISAPAHTGRQLKTPAPIAEGTCSLRRKECVIMATSATDSATISPVSPSPKTSRGCVDATRVYARAMGTVAVFNLDDKPPLPDPEDAGWRHHLGREAWNLWLHPEFPRYLVHCAGNSIAVIQRARGRTSMKDACAVARSFLGREKEPSHVFRFPLAVRLRVRLLDGASLELPERGTRGHRIGEPKMMAIGGIPVELRLTASVSMKGTLTLWSEAFIGGAHETREGDPRACVFDADMRKLPRLSEAGRIRLLCGVLEALISFAQSHHSTGVVVDTAARSSMPRLAMVHVLPGLAGPVLDVWFPTLEGRQRFAAFAGVRVGEIQTAEDLRVIIRRLQNAPRQPV